MKAAFYELLGERKEAKALFAQAFEAAAIYDKAPSFDVRNTRFLDLADESTVFDNLGETAIDSMREVMKVSGLEQVVGKRFLDAFGKEYENAKEKATE